MRSNGFAAAFFLFFILCILTACTIEITPKSVSAESTVSTDANNAKESENSADSSKTAGSSETDTNEKAGEQSSRYIGMLKTQRYYIKYRGVVEADGQEASMEIEMAQQDGDSAVRLHNGDNVVRMVTKDQKYYTIMDTQKTIIITDQSEQNSISTDIMDTSDAVYTGAGSEEFGGRTLNYEEYTAGANHVLFFFDGSALAGIRVITAAGTANDMEVVEMSEDIPSEMFDIPTDYTKAAS